MKVLQINVVYNFGSTGKIVCDIHRKLQEQGIESVVCYGRGESVREPHVHKISSELYAHVNHIIASSTGVIYGGCWLSTHRLISIIRREKPDIVHLHCLNGYWVNIYRLINWLKAHRINTVLTLHAEFMHTGGCSHAMDCQQWMRPEGCGKAPCPRYRNDIKSWFFDRSRHMWKRMKAAFDGFDENLIITSVSPWLMQRAAASPILSGKRHCVVLNGIDTDIFHPYSPDSALQLRRELGITAKQVILHATAGFSDEAGHPKGGEYIIELARRMPETCFLIAGRSSISKPLPPNLLMLGMVTDQHKLAQLYSMADLTVIASQKETFSMIVAESLCCGTPVVGFKAGAPEMIALPEYSAFADFGDTNALEQHVRNFLNRHNNTSEISQHAFEKYSRHHMVNEYCKVYSTFVQTPVAD